MTIHNLNDFKTLYSKLLTIEILLDESKDIKDVQEISIMIAEIMRLLKDNALYEWDLYPEKCEGHPDDIIEEIMKERSK